MGHHAVDVAEAEPALAAAVDRVRASAASVTPTWGRLHAVTFKHPLAVTDDGFGAGGTVPGGIMGVTSSSSAKAIRPATMLCRML